MLTLTARDCNGYLVKMMEAGMAGCLITRTSAQKLVKAIRRAQRGEALFDEQQLGEAVSYDQILDEVWGCDPDTGGTREQVKTVVKRLRKKIEPDPNQPQYIISVLSCCVLPALYCLHLRCWPIGLRCQTRFQIQLLKQGQVISILGSEMEMLRLSGTRAVVGNMRLFLAGWGSPRLE